jgi:hypothetical protein
VNVSTAKTKLLSGEQLFVEVMRNPSDLSEWVSWVHELSGKSFLLSADDGIFIKSADTTKIFDILKALGFRQATVIF